MYAWKTFRRSHLGVRLAKEGGESEGRMAREKEGPKSTRKNNRHSRALNFGAKWSWRNAGGRHGTAWRLAGRADASFFGYTESSDRARSLRRRSPGIVLK